MRDFCRDYRRSEASVWMHPQNVKDFRHVSYPLIFVRDGHVDRGHREDFGGCGGSRKSGLLEFFGGVCSVNSNSRCPEARSLKSHFALKNDRSQRLFPTQYRDPAYLSRQRGLLVSI